MIRHLLKLVWNRKGTNLLLMVEIFFSFLVLFAVVTLGFFYIDNYRHPLGYRYDDVWRVSLDTKIAGNWPPEAMETLRRLQSTVTELGEVEAMASAFNAPYENASWTSGYTVDGKVYDYELNVVGDAFADVLRMEVPRGRFFSREDDGASWNPVLINEHMAEDVFGTEDPVGRLIPQDKHSDGTPRTEMRVIGVFRDYRQHGDYSVPNHYVLHRRADSEELAKPRVLLVKVRPGTPAAFEETLLARLQATAKDWSFTVKPLAEMRDSNHRERLAPVLAFSLVAGFLLLMVALGLTGVLWQSVTQRTREIGLRRAKGASAGRIHTQILGEILLMTSLALGLAVVVVAQLPLLDLLGFVRPGVFASSLAISVVALYGVTVACGFYPSRIATRIAPADALRYE
jgi:putative ABC transport system permease protein